MSGVTSIARSRRSAPGRRDIGRQRDAIVLIVVAFFVLEAACMLVATALVARRDVLPVVAGTEKLMATMLATMATVNCAARDLSRTGTSVATAHNRHAGSDRTRSSSRVCRGGGVRRRLKEMVGRRHLLVCASGPGRDQEGLERLETSRRLAFTSEASSAASR